MNFVNALNSTLNENFNYSRTENGALGYRTTGQTLLDLNFQVASLRKLAEVEVEDRFVKAFYEDPLTAVKWLFYAGDIRQGLGERRLFKIGLTYLANNHPDVVTKVITLIPEYNRWDSAWVLLKTNLKDQVILVIRNQLEEDLVNMAANKSISLLAKWMKSLNASSKETKKLAKIMCDGLGMTERQYRKTLSKLRGYLKIVERDMSAKKWEHIDYSTVPSRANLVYNSAFLRNDEERRRSFLEALERGDKDVKINAGTLFPHDIVHQYAKSRNVDATLEQLWKALPDLVNGEENVIVVADGSGSMTDIVDKQSSVTALEIANAIAIYFAERSSGQFKNQYITFSSKPQLVNLTNGQTLRAKIDIARRYDEVANTNIGATFELILQTAVSCKMTQEELPKTVLIISDMEFDNCASGYLDARSFKIIADRFASAGYQLPRLVFWNVNSRTGTIPVKQNALGVALVSGFSINICKMVMSNKLDPYECLMEQVNSERYQPVEDAVASILKTGKVE